MGNEDAIILTGKSHSRTDELLLDWCLEPAQTLIMKLFESTVFYF